MKRDDHGYTIDDHDIIRNPGKFEGEPLYVVHFYDLVMDGAGDTHYDGDTPTDFFILDADDHAVSSDLDGVYGLAIWESNQGFVDHETFATERDYQTAIEMLDSAEVE